MNLPPPNADSAPFWAATAEDRLLFQRCANCARAHFPPRAQCLACGGPLQWEASSKRGVIHSFTIVQRAPTAAFKARVPYVIALVDLAEGPRLMLNVRDGANEPRLGIGAPVRVVFEETEDAGRKLPQAVLV